MPGHWEGDLIKGARNQSAVGTLVCRKTLFVRLVKVDGSTALDALHGFEQAFAPLPPQARKTLTYDQGKEMAPAQAARAEHVGGDLLRRPAEFLGARHL